MTDIACTVEQLEVALDSGATIIRDISFSVGRGEVLGVVGESGSGKSTLALALLGFTRKGATITAGGIRIGDVDMLALSPSELLQARGSKIAYVPQDPATALNPKLSLRTQLTETLTDDAALDRVKRILGQVGLPNDDAFLRRKPKSLSGGQQQRVAIAIAIAAEPDVIVFDEPTTGLDVTTQAQVLELVRALCAERRIAAIYVTHDLAVVADLADDILVMYGGEIVENGTAQSIITAPSHPYTRALLAAVPSARQRHLLVPIPGRAPSVGAVTRGCVFAPRCQFAVDECFTTAPPLVQLETGVVTRCHRTETVRATPYVHERELRPRLEGATSEAVFAVSDLQAFYSGVHVLHDVAFTVAAGEALAIVGESGSGKTTLSRCLIGLHEEQSGSIVFDGERIPPAAGGRTDRTRREIQYVFQNPYGSLNPRRTIGASLELALRHFGGARSRRMSDLISESLERVELAPGVAENYPGDLSGGQRQRVAIARALLAQPKLLICDEVTSALDVSVQASIVELLRGLLHDGLGMLFITHNLAVVRSIADSVLVLNRGHVVESGAMSSVLDRPTHAYTRRLMADTLDVPEPTGRPHPVGGAVGPA